MKDYVIIFVIALAFVVACGTSTSSEDNEIEVLDPYSDPPGITGNPFVGFGEISTVTFPAVEDDNFQQDIQQLDVEEGSWSVQIAACATENSAKSLRDILEASIDYPVFIDQIGNYYKVRVGSFATSASSDDLRIYLRSNGYSDAWSVER